MNATAHTPNSSLAIERLESRDVPAGDVSVVLTGGALTVTGDAADNQLTIQQFSNGEVVVTGSAGTTINGRGDSVSLGVVALDAVRLAGGDGADQLAVAGVTTAGEVVVTGDAGNDSLFVSNTTAGSLTVNAGAGDDLVTTNGVWVAGFADLSGGDGSDTLRYSSLSSGGGMALSEFEAAFAGRGL